MGDISVKLSKYLSDNNISQKMIAETLGVSEQFVNALVKGRNSFGKKTAAEWQKHFGLSASWLLTGEGEMLNSPIQQISGVGNVQVGGDAHNVNSGSTIDRMVELFSESQEQVKRRDEQIDRLLSIIERMQDVR